MDVNKSRQVYLYFELHCEYSVSLILWTANRSGIIIRATQSINGLPENSCIFGWGGQGIISAKHRCNFESIVWHLKIIFQHQEYSSKACSHFYFMQVLFLRMKKLPQMPLEATHAEIQLNNQSFSSQPAKPRAGKWLLYWVQSIYLGNSLNLFPMCQTTLGSIIGHKVFPSFYPVTLLFLKYYRRGIPSQ